MFGKFGQVCQLNVPMRHPRVQFDRRNYAVNAPQFFGSVSLALQFLATRETDPAGALALAGQLARKVLDSPPSSVSLSFQAELERILPIPVAAGLQGTSIDTVLREDQRRIARGEPSRIVQLSERRHGMRLKHALRLAD